MRPNRNTTREENDSTPSLIKHKLFDELINEMCGHVNDDLRNLWYVSCDCNCDQNDEEITEAKKTSTDYFMKFHRYLIQSLMTLKEDPYLNLELVLPSRDRKPKILMKEHLYSPIHIPGDEPIVVLGANSTFISKSDFDKISWKCARSAARKLCGLLFSRDKILQTDFEKTFLEPHIIADIESCTLALSHGNSEDIFKSIARKCYDTRRKYVKVRIYTKKLLD